MMTLGVLRVFFVAALATFIAVGIVLVPSNGNALARRIHATTCFPSGVTPSLSSAGVSPTGAGLLDLYCPTPDDDWLPRTTIQFLNVHGRVTTSGGSQVAYISAIACRSSWSFGPGGTCGNPHTIFAGGSSADVTLNPSLSVWQAGGADFPYLQVTLRTFNANDSSSLRGYFVAQ